MRKIAISIVIVLFNMSAFAQKESIELSSEQGRNNEFIINARVNDIGTYSVIINLYNSISSAIRQSEVKVVKKSGEIMRLNPEILNKYSPVPYTHAFILGDVNADIDTNFVYCLPYSIHKNSIEYDKITSIQFQLSPGDTVFAIRKGTIVNVPYMNAGERHVVYIQHEDGAIVGYANLNKKSVMVKEGDKVNAYTPIGIVDPGNNQSNKLFLLPSYVVTAPSAKEPSTQKTLGYKNFNIKFATDKGNKMFENIVKRYSHK